MSFLCQSPVWRLWLKQLGFFESERRYSPATGSAGLADKSFGHVACSSNQPSRAPRQENCQILSAFTAPSHWTDVITAAAAPVGSAGRSPVPAPSARTRSASITLAGIRREILEFVRPPFPILRVRRGRFLSVMFGQIFAYWAFSNSHFSSPQFGVRLDRVDRAFRLADAAIDTFVRVDDQHVLAFVEAVHGRTSTQSMILQRMQLSLTM